MDALRIDKFLWFARLFKTRSQAASAVEAGEVLVNGQVAAKAAHAVRIGDDLVVPAGKRFRRVEVAALPERRGPAPEAQAAYRELEPPPPEAW